jgi:hypothetical protein
MKHRAIHDMIERPFRLWGKAFLDSDFFVGVNVADRRQQCGVFFFSFVAPSDFTFQSYS